MDKERTNAGHIIFTLKSFIDIYFKNAVAIDRDTPVNSVFIRVIGREMISQSVIPTHHASIFPAKGTCVVKMAARIEARAFFSKREKCNKTLENFKSSHQVEISVFCTKNVAAANSRLSPKVVHHPLDHKYAHAQYGCIYSGKPRNLSSGLRLNQPKSGLFKTVYYRPYTKYPMTLTPTADRVTLSIKHQRTAKGPPCQ